MSPTPDQYTTFHQYIHPSSNIYTFWDTTYFVQSNLKFSDPKNLNFLPSNTYKCKWDKFLTWASSLTYTSLKRPKRSKFDIYLDHETAVHTLLAGAACWWFVSVAPFRSLFSTFNSATFSNHLKTPNPPTKQATEPMSVARWQKGPHCLTEESDSAAPLQIRIWHKALELQANPENVLDLRSKNDSQRIQQAASGSLSVCQCHLHY